MIDTVVIGGPGGGLAAWLGWPWLAAGVAGGLFALAFVAGVRGQMRWNEAVTPHMGFDTPVAFVSNQFIKDYQKIGRAHV